MADTTDLILPSNNLYRNGQVFVFDNGDELLLRETMAFDATLTDKYHILRTTDTLDYLAWYYYRDIVADPSKFWYVIGDANGIINPLDLSDHVGEELLIPNIIKAELRI